MLTSKRNSFRSAMRMAPPFSTIQSPCGVETDTFAAATLQHRNHWVGTLGGGRRMSCDFLHDGKRCVSTWHTPIRGSTNSLYRQKMTIAQDTSGMHSFRMITTICDDKFDRDKNEKARLATLRLYRILQRLCASLVSTKEGTIFLQNDIRASDWGNYHIHSNKRDDNFMEQNQTEDLLRLFLTLSGTDPTTGTSKQNEWFNDLMRLGPKNTKKNTNTKSSWTTPTNLREAIRFAFRSSSQLALQHPSDLQALAIRAIQIVEDQVKLWNQSSVSNTTNGLVRVVATSRCLGTVSPMSIVPSYSPLHPKYRFAYRIRIENVSSSETVQLLGRYWHIAEVHVNSDSTENAPEPIEVDAPYTGALGQLPVLQPGQVFEYVSGTDLSAPKGEMMGHLYMATVPPQTRSAKSGDDVKAITYLESKVTSPTGFAQDFENCRQTKLFQATVKPFLLESFDK